MGKNEHKRKKCIGVFDSGFGGIDVLRHMAEELPEYDYLYLGDTARVPYGNRSKETVYEFTEQAVDFLCENDCAVIILACNTASSDALRKIQRKYIPKYRPEVKVLGVLVPIAEEAAARSKNKKIGVLATEGTVRSGAFPRELAKIDPHIDCFQIACPLLVPIVEAGEQNSPAAKMILKNYLAPLDGKGIDTLILGCTHYGILKKAIRGMLPRGVAVVSGADAVPKRLRAYLEKHADIEEKIRKNGTVRFRSTDMTEKFSEMGSVFFGKKISARKVSLPRISR